MTRLAFVLGVAALLLAACTPAQRQVSAVSDPAYPGARTPRASYRPVMSGYEPIRPADPVDWGSVNRRVTPPAGAR